MWCLILVATLVTAGCGVTGPQASGIYSARGAPNPRPILADVIDPAARAIDLPPLSEVELPTSVREVRVWLGFGVAIPHDLVRIVQTRGEVAGDLGRFWEERSFGPPDDRLWADEFRTELEGLGCHPIQVSNGVGACIQRSSPSIEWSRLLEQLDSLGVSDLPDQSQLLGEGAMILDGWTMVVEVLDGRAYRSYSYSIPDEGARPEERTADAMGRVLRTFISRAYALDPEN